MNDFEYQVSYVADSVERITAQVDMDPISPTFGCAHLAYWRDKTSDVADMRRQEAMLTLAMLYSHEYPGSRWHGDIRILCAVAALLRFWTFNQNSDGSFDEWYKGERGFAATAFTSHAAARTLLLIGETLDPALKTSAEAALRKAADWLTGHDDLFKTNHQAVAVCALVWCYKALKNEKYKESALEKFESIRAVQRSEGWFPEVGNVDIGYTFLTVEFLAMAMEALNDWTQKECVIKAFDFACNWLDPNVRLGEEYSICRNSCVSRIAIVLLSEYSSAAGPLLRKLSDYSAGFDGIRPTLADELRLNRWSYLPLIAYGHYEIKLTGNAGPGEKKAVCFQTVVFSEAGLVRISQREYGGVFAAAAGGLLRLFDTTGANIITDFGYVIYRGGEKLSNCVYDRELNFQEAGGAIETTCPMAPVKKFFPPYFARVMLRAACGTVLGSRFTRRLIDIYRKNKGTALNQSSSNLKGRTSRDSIFRRVILKEKEVVVEDRISLSSETSPDAIFFHTACGYGVPAMEKVSDFTGTQRVENKSLNIVKTYKLSSDGWKRVCHG